MTISWFFMSILVLSLVKEPSDQDYADRRALVLLGEDNISSFSTQVYYAILYVCYAICMLFICVSIPCYLHILYYLFI